MKVIVLASLAYSLVNFRAALLEDLKRRGHTVLACAPDEDAEVLARLGEMGIAFRKIPMDRAGLNPWSDVATLAAYVRLFRAEKPDLILAYTQKPIVYGGIAARIATRKAAFHAMVSGLGHIFSDCSDSGLHPLRRLVALLYRIATARARSIVVFNECDGSDMRAWGLIAPDRAVVRVPGSGIDLERFAKVPVPCGPPLFLMVARMLRDKGVVEFIEAAKRIRGKWPQARFQMLGWLDETQRGFSREELQALLAGSGVEYLGHTRDVQPYLACASVFVLPTYYREGLPRTILEAMAVGRPIITTNMPGCRETVITGFNGYLVSPRDPISLAEAMTRFLEQEALASAMGKRSRWLVRRRFDVRRVNALLLQAMLPPTASAIQRAGRARGLTDYRLVEISLTLCLALLLLPLGVLTAAIVWATLGRPLLFVQRRTGAAGKPFALLKFRTMRDERDEEGRQLPDAHRLGRTGRLLRRSRLDEIPEILNILKGHMALIGPRPLLPETIAALGVQGLSRCAVRPGLTGWAQVNGNTRLTEHEKLALDLWYVHRRSLWLDLRILGRTLIMLIAGERIDPVQIGRAYAGAADRGG